MAFKMKGFPLHSGTSPAKQYKSDAQRKAIYASKAERSAAKQKSANLKTLDELIEEGFTPADARRMQKDKAVTGVQKETDKQKMQRLEDEAAKANKAGDKEKAKKLMAQVNKLEDKIQGTTKPPTKQTEKQRKKLPPNLVKEIEKANKMEDRPDPTYEGTDEFRKEKDIPKKEFKKRGVKKPPTKQRSISPRMIEKPRPLPPSPSPNIIPSVRRANFEPVEFIPRPMPEPLPNPSRNIIGGIRRANEPMEKIMTPMPPIEQLRPQRQYLGDLVEVQQPKKLEQPEKQSSRIMDFNTTSIPKEKKKGKKGPGRRSKVGKKLTKVANIFRKKGNKRSPDFK